MKIEFFKYTLLGLFILYNTYIKAQTNYLFNDTIKNCLVAEAGYIHNSTALTNEFLKTIYAGKFISTDNKDNVKRRLSAMNLFGQEYNASVYGIIHFDSLLHSSNNNLYVGLSSKSFLNIYFPKDAFKIIFYGNKDFLGDTAYFNQLCTTSYQYQTFDMGWIHQKNYANLSLTSSIKLSFIKGQQLLDFGLINGFMYTANSGNTIDFGGRSFLMQSDTSKTRYRGTGSAISFFTDIFVSEKSKIHIEFNDMGFITWNKNTLTFSGDTSVSFNGYDLVKLISGNNNQTNIDSINNLIFNSDKKRKIYHSITGLRVTVLS